MSQSSIPPASSSPGARPQPVPASAAAQQQQQQQQQQHQGSPTSRGTSPAFDRNRTVRAQSMQAYATANAAAAASSPPAAQQAFPTKPTPPPTTSERPPPPQHALSQPIVQQSSTAPRNPHRHSAPLYNAFMPPGPEAFAMHPEIMAELELRAQGLVHAATADITPNLAAGLGGIAYSGGASSSSVNVAGLAGTGGERERERERAPELTRRGSMRDQAQAQAAQQAYDQQQLQQAYEYEQSRYDQQQAYEQQYRQYDREAYIPLPPAGRSPATPPPPQSNTTRKTAPAYVPSPVATAPAKLPNASAGGKDAIQKRDSGGKDPIPKGNKDPRAGTQGQGQGQGQGTPELPVHEDDAEQDHILAERWPAGRTPSPVPSSDILPDALRRKTAEQPAQGVQPPDGEERSAGEDSHTPRSPVNSLPMHQSHAIAAMLNARHHPRRRLDSAASSAFGIPPPSEYGQASEYMFAHPAEDPRWGHLFDEPDMSYYTGAYSNSPVTTNSRPGAPIPPTSAAPSPLPAHLQMNAARAAALRQAYSPAPMPTGSPYPFPFGHIPRGSGPPQGYAGTGTLDSMDAAAVQEQLAAQMRTYAANNGGLESVSTLSPRASPAPWPYPPGHNPWAYVQTSRVYGAHPMYPPQRRHALASDVSMRSSPSHEPVHLPMQRGNPRVRRGSSLRPQAGANGTRGKGGRKNVRPASTQPRDTSPEPSSSSGEETALESHAGHEDGIEDDIEEEEDEETDRVEVEEGMGKGKGVGDDERPASESTAYATGSTGEDEWVDVSDDDTEDLLGIEFHSDFIGQPEKRRKRFEARWSALVRAFNELDRETDTPMVLLAAPSHTPKLHAHTSRALRRARTSPAAAAHMTTLRRSFSLLAAERAPSAALPALWETLSASSRAGTPSAPEMAQLLDTALGSLAALGEMYRAREARWAEEMGRAEEERERVQLLMRQVLGAGGGAGFRNTWSPMSAASSSSSAMGHGVNGMVNGAGGAGMNGA
ncbi:hypothetical protein PENSPDRAFT_755448 [Peniophora sp. CONT]|nr:hypothetical protein PENSPDRAFT_755448 [Peniophora sp. CONT]